MTITHYTRAQNQDHHHRQDREPVRGRHYRHNQQRHTAPLSRSYPDPPRPYRPNSSDRSRDFDTRLQALLDTTMDRYRQQHRHWPKPHQEPVTQSRYRYGEPVAQPRYREPATPHREQPYRNPFLYPTGELARRTAEYTRAREAAEAVPKEHLPQWRIKAWLLWRFIPVMWVLKLCRHKGCRDRWPCGPIMCHARNVKGRRGDTTTQLRALSTKRRRARAAARTPGAISHRTHHKPRPHR